MTSITTATNDAGFLARLAGNSATVRRQLETAQEQQATGKVSSTYAGLGAGARTSLSVRPAVEHVAVWQRNIDATTGRLAVTQGALTQISSIAADFFAKTNALTQIGTPADVIAGQARDALKQVSELLNTRDGDVYVFAGEDTANPPLPDTDPAVVGAAVLASDTATAPFSATLGPAPAQIEVGDGQRVQAGLVANKNTLVNSPPPTTGSFARDILKALASLAAATPGPGVEATAAGARKLLGSAITAISGEAGTLGSVEAGLASRKQTLAALQTTLSQQVSNVEDVDLAATLIRATSLQTQLQASYQTIAGAKNLSLANYL